MQSTRTIQTSVPVIGPDYLGNVELMGRKRGDILFKVLLEPGVSRRLRSQANNFQRIRWNRLELQVQTSAGTNLGGTYQAVFIPDPADEEPKGVDETEILRWVTEQATSVSSAAWQSSKLPVPARFLNREFWTSIEDEGDIRLLSPGTFYVVMVQPTTDVNASSQLDFYLQYNASCKIAASPEQGKVSGDSIVEILKPITVTEATPWGIVEVDESDMQLLERATEGRQGIFRAFDRAPVVTAGETSVLYNVVGFQWSHSGSNNQIVLSAIEVSGALLTSHGSHLYMDSTLWGPGDKFAFIPKEDSSRDFISGPVSTSQNLTIAKSHSGAIVSNRFLKASEHKWASWARSIWGRSSNNSGNSQTY